MMLADISAESQGDFAAGWKREGFPDLGADRYRLEPSRALLEEVKGLSNV